MKFSKDQFSSVFDQIAVLKSYYTRLSDRERYIVLGTAAALLIGFLFLVYMIISGSVSSLERKIEKNQKQKIQLQKLKTKYQNAEREVNEIERVIRRTEANFQLATALEKISQKYGISIETLKDRAGQPNDLYQEKQSTVTVKEVNLRTLIHFLHDIENSRQLMRITSLQIKPNFKDPSLLNVNFVVSTFQMKSES